ncbi:MerR family transcriptional regulator [Streptomyces sp. G5(2025)]|uniref:MerR family transcriptional regulator n=1 Tax=Streptomyces sp. G5(2025) TaxID=3406628 RepID=UPI003C186A3E
MSENPGGLPIPAASPASPAHGLSIGQVAEATGLSVHALRFFEREGLFLREIPRSSGGRRVYEQADVDWLLLCGRLRASGMPIATIREFAALIRSGPGNERDRLALLQEHERDIRAKIDDLKACLEIVHSKVVTYEQHLRDGTAAGLWAPSPTLTPSPSPTPSLTPSTTPSSVTPPELTGGSNSLDAPAPPR